MYISQSKGQIKHTMFSSAETHLVSSENVVVEGRRNIIKIFRVFRGEVSSICPGSREEADEWLAVHKRDYGFWINDVIRDISLFTFQSFGDESSERDKMISIFKTFSLCLRAKKYIHQVEPSLLISIYKNAQELFVSNVIPVVFPRNIMFRDRASYYASRFLGETEIMWVTQYQRFLVTIPATLALPILEEYEEDIQDCPLFQSYFLGKKPISQWIDPELVPFLNRLRIRHNKTESMLSVSLVFYKKFPVAICKNITDYLSFEEFVPVSAYELMCQIGPNNRVLRRIDDNFYNHSVISLFLDQKPEK